MNRLPTILISDGVHFYSAALLLDSGKNKCSFYCFVHQEANLPTVSSQYI